MIKIIKELEKLQSARIADASFLMREKMYSEIRYVG